MLDDFSQFLAAPDGYELEGLQYQARQAGLQVDAAIDQAFAQALHTPGVDTAMGQMFYQAAGPRQRGARSASRLHASENGFQGAR